MKHLIFTIACTVILVPTVCLSQHWPNPENQMLSDSMSSFFYYSNNTDTAFSDPRSLMDTEKRSRISDNYHDQSEYELEMNRQRMQMEYPQNRRRLYNSNKPSYNNYNPNYKLHYLHQKSLK
jgi:hypothetical protein